MAVYKYKAVNTTGSFVKGRLEAANSPDLESRLLAMGLELIQHKTVRARDTIFLSKQVTRKELIDFCFHMEQMSRAGVPILDSLVDLRDSLEKCYLQQVISTVIASIEGGKRLSEALADYPSVFDPVFISLIQAGEHTGELEKVMLNMTESLKWQDELIAKTKSALRYPIFAGTVVFAVVIFMMTYLVPLMTDFIKNLGQELPFHTKALIAVSNVFVNFWYLIVGLPILGFIIIKIAVAKSESARYRLDQFKLNAWLVGPILKKYILARFTSYFALLYQSGVNVLTCLSIVENISGNLVVKTALQQARQMTSDGMRLSDAIARTGLFPPLVLRMLKIGESTGRLDTSMANVSYFYNRDVNESVEKLQGKINPYLIITLAAVMGWLMISVLGPIYDVMGTIK